MASQLLPIHSLKRDTWVIFFLIALMLAAGLGLRDPWPADEPRFALIAKQMVESGEFLFPRRGSELYADKPPLFMWFQALSYILIGSWRIAFLLPSLLASLATLVLVYDLAKRFSTKRSALLATVCCATTLQFSFQAKGAQIDPLVVFWITLGSYGLLRHLVHQPHWGWYLCAWFAAGLGIITKGVGIVVLLMFLPYGLARWQQWPGLACARGGWRWALGPLFLFLPLLAWLIPVLIKVMSSHNPEYALYVDDLLFRQTAQRYANPWHHIKPFYYFIEVILFSWWPVTAVLLLAIPALYRRLRKYHVRVVLPCLWALLVVIFFSLSPGKRDMYVLPALPTLCVGLAPLLPGLLVQRQVIWLLRGVMGAISLVFTAGGAWALLGDPKFAQLGIDGDAIWFMVLFLGCVGWVVLFILRRNQTAKAWFVFSVIIWTTYGVCGYPILNATRSSKEVMQKAAAIIGPQAELAMVAWKEQNYLQADRAVTDFGFRRPIKDQRDDAFTWVQKKPHHRYVFTQEVALGECIDIVKVKPVGFANRRHWVLFGSDAIISGCAE